MKSLWIKNSILFLSTFLLLFTIIKCERDSSFETKTNDKSPQIVLTGSLSNFDDTKVLENSEYKSIQVKGIDLNDNINIKASNNFEISLDNNTFSSDLILNKEEAISVNKTIYVRFSPIELAIGTITGTLKFNSTSASEKTLNLAGKGLSSKPLITVLQGVKDFENVTLQNNSDPQKVSIKGENLTSDISITISDSYQISIDGTTYLNTLTIDASLANNQNDFYVRFIPSTIAETPGTISISSIGADNVDVILSGSGVPITYSYTTFDKKIVGPSSQWNKQYFNLHTDLSNISKITMYVKLDCESTGCPPWDVFGTLKVKDVDSEEYFELGRFITPYGKNTNQLERGFAFDVTDFKTLLQGNVELQTRIVTWSKRWLLTVEFDYEQGTPDYPYYEISRVFNYAWDPKIIPYGATNDKDLTRTITIPSNAESTHLRTIISGWGHATPIDSDSRPCAEWCYRTHDVKIDNAVSFSHYMGPIGCNTNPIQPQSGNWSPDRAGWCPGMAVPTRMDEFSSSMFGNTFNLEYSFEDWTSDGGNTSGQPGAYYSLSQFVVVKSNTAIEKPTVIE